MTVTPVNDPPVAVDDVAVVVEDLPVTIDVLATDSDPDGDVLTIDSFTQPSNGTVTFDDGGTPSDPSDDTLVYTPNANFTGSDSFTYTICDPSDACVTATVTVDVTQAPALGAITGIVWWDLDADGTFDSGETQIGLVRIVIVGFGPDQVLGTADDVSYPSVFSGGPYFLGGLPAGRYQVTVDESTLPANVRTRTYDLGGALTGTVTATVIAGQTRSFVDFGYINLAPNAANDSILAPEGQAVTISVLTNDRDPEGGALTVTRATAPFNGSVAVNADGTITYTPNPGFDGTDSFTYTVCDPGGECATATVIVTVTNTNGPPQPVTASSLTVAKGATWQPLVFIDTPNVYTVSLVGGELPSGVRLNDDGSFTGTTATTGTFTITVRACDQLGACANYTFTITVRDFTLPSTGSNSVGLTEAAMMVLGIGIVLAAIGRRRELRRGLIT